MGEARRRKLAGDTAPRGMVRREKPAWITCSGCGIEIASREGAGLCGRCAAAQERIATTGSLLRRLINRPRRRDRRAKKGSNR